MPKEKPQKPKKPHKDYPLTPHATKRWCKKVRGKLYYFGSWGDPTGALQEYLKIKDQLQAGLDPRVNGCTKSKITTADVVNSFLERTDKRVQLGELSPLSFSDYKVVGSLIVDHFGRHREVHHIQPNDFAGFRFAMGAKYAPSRLSKIIAVTRMIFSWSYESELLEKPVRFGPDFKVSSKSEKRIHRNNSPKKLLTSDEVLKLIDAADTNWKAILLLAINCGLGNTDLSRITLSDVGGDWLDLSRMKRGVNRHLPLWKETQNAIQDVIKDRREPKPDASNLLFLSGHGGPLIKVRADGKKTDLTIEGFRRVAKRAGIHRPRMGLYWMRHTFQSHGDEVRDHIATSSLMGHIDTSTAGEYREFISDERLLRVTNHVHDWLFGEPVEIIGDHE